MNKGKCRKMEADKHYERQAGVNFIGKGGLIQLALSEWVSYLKWHV